MEYILDVLSNPLAVVVVLLVVLVMVYCVGTYNYWVLNGMNVPGAKPLPFLGNLRDMSKYGGIHLGLLEYTRKYGKVYSLCIGRNASIVIADPEILKQIMVKDFQNFTNRYFVGPRGKGLFTYKDDDWKRVRNVLTPTFTSGKLKLMVPLIEKSCNTLVGKVEEIADTGKSVDMFSWFGLMTLEVILASAFGLESPVQTDSTDNMFLIKAREVMKMPLRVRVLMMFPFTNVLIQLFTLFGGRRSFFKKVAAEIIEHRKTQDFQRSKLKDLVDIMLAAKYPDGKAILDEEEINAQSMAILIAGYETSSNTLSMSAYFLALHPDVQERLRCEIHIAQQTNPEKPVYELVNELEYLECVINEVLRLSPPAHMVNRLCTNAYKLNDKTTIPADMEVIIPIYTLHHDPEAWPEPEAFDPERFRGLGKESRHPFQFLPFGEGPRNCIGKRFALLEVKITLVNILTKYKFVRCPETQVPLEMTPGITLIPKHGVYVKVESCK